MARIVSCDDDADVRRIISSTLEKVGHEVFGGRDGEEGIELVIEAEPDLVITDIEMPKMNGYEVVKKLRSSNLTKNIPIIMLSALSKDEERVYGLEQGADDYLTKPFSPKELRLKVDLLLQRTEELRALKGELGNVRKGKIITFLGVKGGVGTSTIVINTALALQSAGKDICACDLNQDSGIFNFLLGTNAERTVEHLLREDVLDLDEDLLKSYLTVHEKSRLSFLSSPREIAVNRNNMYQLKKLQKILSYLKAYFALVIIDGGSDINILSSALGDITDTLILCLNLDFLSLSNLKRINMYFQNNQVDLSKVKVLVNHRSIHSNFKVDVVKKIVPLEIIGEIANDGSNFSRSLKNGKPFIDLFPKSKVSKQIQDLGKSLLSIEESKE